jgi:hypothetical protein
MNPINDFNINIEPLCVELNNVMKRGLNDTLKDVFNNYKMYENSHQIILNLTKVIHDSDNKSNNIQNNNSMDNQELFNKIKLIIDNTVTTQIDIFQHMMFDHIKLNTDQVITTTKNYIDEKINNLVNNLVNNIVNESVQNSSIINQLFGKIELLNTQLVALNNNNTTSVPCILETANILESVTILEPVTILEKENITLEIQENESDDKTEVDDDEILDDITEVDEEEKLDNDVETEADDITEVDNIDGEEEIEETEENIEIKIEIEKVEQKDTENKEEAEEEELFEIEIDDITYCTNDEENGFIYEVDKDGDVGKKVGFLKEGEPTFY